MGQGWVVATETTWPAKAWIFTIWLFTGKKKISPSIHLTACFWLLCPWNSPGKNTGVGCHSLLQGIFQTQALNPALQVDSLPSKSPGKMATSTESMKCKLKREYIRLEVWMLSLLFQWLPNFTQGNFFQAPKALHSLEKSARGAFKVKTRKVRGNESGEYIIWSSSPNF